LGAILSYAKFLAIVIVSVSRCCFLIYPHIYPYSCLLSIYCCRVLSFTRSDLYRARMRVLDLVYVHVGLCVDVRHCIRFCNITIVLYAGVRLFIPPYLLLCLYTGRYTRPRGVRCVVCCHSRACICKRACVSSINIRASVYPCHCARFYRYDVACRYYIDYVYFSQLLLSLSIYIIYYLTSLLVCLCSSLFVSLSFSGAASDVRRPLTIAVARGAWGVQSINRGRSSRSLL